ncbi:unnamed protein product [Ectocarpus sp. 13 AM-2016]
MLLCAKTVRREPVTSPAVEVHILGKALSTASWLGKCSCSFRTFCATTNEPSQPQLAFVVPNASACGGIGEFAHRDGRTTNRRCCACCKVIRLTPRSMSLSSLQYVSSVLLLRKVRYTVVAGRPPTVSSLFQATTPSHMLSV